MHLDDFDGDKIYVDTNVIYLLLREDTVYSPVAKRFFEKVKVGTITAYTAVLTLDELLYRLILALIKDNQPGNPIEQLRNNEAELLQQFAPLILPKVKQVTRIPNLRLIGISLDDAEKALNTFNTGLLMPRDCFHYQIMKKVGCNTIASDDLAFERLPDIQRYGIFES